MVQFISKAFLTLTFFALSGRILAQEVLVQNFTTYVVGQYIEMKIPISDMLVEFGVDATDVGSISILVESKRTTQWDGRHWILFQINVTFDSVTLYSGNGRLLPETWIGYLKTINSRGRLSSKF